VFALVSASIRHRCRFADLLPAEKTSGDRHIVIQNFVVQPYPLFAIVVVAGRMEPHIGRVVGWERVDDGPGGVLGPVLTLGARTFVPGVADHVAYEDSREEAERRASVFAAAARPAKELRDERPVPEQRTGRSERAE
jgi:hypothetical protein